MMEAGLIPNKVDYYDVDTDPSGRFEPGQPFRIHMYSTVPGSKVDTTKQRLRGMGGPFLEPRYLSIEALPSVFEVAGMFEFFNVTKLHGPCDFARELLVGNTSNATNITGPAFDSAQELAHEAFLARARRCELGK